jgi:hypothetical protein
MMPCGSLLAGRSHGPRFLGCATVSLRSAGPISAKVLLEKGYCQDGGALSSSLPGVVFSSRSGDIGYSVE